MARSRGKTGRSALPVGDAMLDRDGTIVEPQVRRAIRHYFKKMQLRETTYARRTDFFANKWQDPQEEYYEDNDDPVGLQLHARQEEMRRQMAIEGVVRSLVRETLRSSPPPKALTPQDLAIVDLKYYAGTPSTITVVYSVSGLKSYVKELGEIGPVATLALARRVASDPGLLRSVVAGVHWGRPHKQHGSCNHSAVVRRSATRVRGYGKLAYIAALSSHGELAPDRNTVKPDAARVWHKFASGGMGVDVEHIPFDDITIKRTPPTSDDCVVHPEDPTLNYSYRLVGGVPTEVAEMQARGEAQFEMLRSAGGKEVLDLVTNILCIEFDTIFRSEYGKD